MLGTLGMQSGLVSRPVCLTRVTSSVKRQTIMSQPFSQRSSAMTPATGLKVAPGLAQSYGKPSTSVGFAGASVAHPGSCRATGDGLYTAMARRAAHFSIIALDAGGHRRREGGEPFVVSIRGPGAVTTSVRDCQDGNYSVGWVVSTKHIYIMRLKLFSSLCHQLHTHTRYFLTTSVTLIPHALLSAPAGQRQRRLLDCHLTAR